MTPTATFVTATGHTGAWPERPTYWSYSSLAEVESCPRRWGLRHATYPDLWDRHGYPDRVSEPSIVGTAVHQGVEEVLRALNAAGCSSIADGQAVEALRTLGGFTAVAAAAAESVLQDLEDNPRMQSHLPRLRQRLQRRTPEMRRAVQTLVSRMSLVSDEPAVGTDDGPDAPRSRIGFGTHPEVNLLAEEQRFIGRVDLLTVHDKHADVLDYKSGQASDHHREQVKLYGLLWMLDNTANPEGLPVGSLTVAYLDHEESVSLPDDWDAMRRELEGRIQAADRAVAAVQPTAVPSPECRHCPVRQMCEEYWESPYLTREPGARFGDVEVTLLEQNGPKSWSARHLGHDGKTLLRTTEADDFEVGQRFRILDVAIEEGRDEDWTVVTLNANSEVFRADLCSPT